MYTTDNYDRAFWNTLRGAAFDEASMNEGRDNSGGFALPGKTADKFAEALCKDNFFRRLSTTVHIPTDTSNVMAVTAEATADWVGEGVAFPESDDDLGLLPFTVKKLAGLTKLKKDFISDNAFDLEGYIVSCFARRFGRAEEDAFLNGNGVDTPWGILGDTNGAEVGVTTAGSAIAFDEVNALFFSLKPEYRSDAVWVMNDETLLNLRSLKDSSGNYLWRGEPDKLNGRPLVVSDHMPSIASGAKPLAFGAFRYYWIAENVPLSVKVLRELYAMSGMVGIAAHELLDGRLIRPEAVKVLKVHE